MRGTQTHWVQVLKGRVACRQPVKAEVLCVGGSQALPCPQSSPKGALQTGNEQALIRLSVLEMLRGCEGNRGRNCPFSPMALLSGGRAGALSRLPRPEFKSMAHAWAPLSLSFPSVQCK